MATKQFPISATGTASIVCPVDPDRRALYVRNYSGSSNSIWLAFGVTATAGTNGEMEIAPGNEYSFGGYLVPTTLNMPLGTKLPNCPLEAVSVITTSGTATGCIVTQ